MAVNLKNDVIFKAVYARENEDCRSALITILNLILDRKKDPITQITYKNPFNTRQVEIQKESILDIKAETSQKEILNLEIQLLYEKHFIPRNLYYHAGMITQALEAGQSYGKMKKTISIFIVDFPLFNQTDQFHNRFFLQENERHFLLTDLTEVHYLELPKVNPNHKPASELTELERYLEYLRLAGDPEETVYLEELKLQGGEEIIMTEKLFKKATADEIIREQAIARDKFLFQQHNFLMHAEEAEAEKEAAIKAANEALLALKKAEKSAKEAAEKAAEKAAKEAYINGQKQLVRNLARNGMSAAQIVEATSLPKTVISQYLQD